MLNKFRKVLTLALCGFLFSCTFTQISASSANDTGIQETSIQQSRAASSTDVQSRSYITTTPDHSYYSQVSASIMQHKLSAYRQPDGSVNIYFLETFHIGRSYYQHLATDKSGKNFVPSKDTAYYTDTNVTPEETPINYMINVPADSVSEDGYVYIYFYLNPYDGVELEKSTYQIPVDYETYKTNPDNYKTATKDKEFQMSASATYVSFNAYASRNDDGTVDAFINVIGSNADLWIMHEATSYLGDIYTPNKNAWYNLCNGDTFNHTYRMVLPKDAISEDGYIYLDIYFNIPAIGMHKVDQIKIEPSF